MSSAQAHQQIVFYCSTVESTVKNGDVTYTYLDFVLVFDLGF